MKRGLVIIALIFVLVFPLVSAISFDMKADYKQGETLITKVSGYFIDPILSSNVFFYKEHTKIPMQFEVSKLGDTYYFYANLDKSQGNYSFIIKNTRHLEFTETTSADITQNFSINNETADFSVAPGFISANRDFSIQARNLIDSAITIQAGVGAGTTENNSDGFFASIFGSGQQTQTLENTTSVVISPGDTKDISFSITSFKNGLNNLELSTENLRYNIPVLASVSASASEQAAQEKSFMLEPEKLNITIATDSNTTRIIFLRNTGNQSISNISFFVSNSLKQYIFLSKNNISELKTNESALLLFTIFSTKSEKTIEGNIKAQGENLLSYSQISLNFLNNYVPSKNETLLSCASIGGQICSSGSCQGDKTETSEGICCLASCEVKSEGSSGNVIAIIIVVVIVGILAFLIIMKAMKKKKPLNILEIAKGKIGK